jgi:Ca2+-transporting ATPase
VGVAMGGRGTDVAREAAAIVLLKDDFASLVRAVRSGRRIYDNLQHAMAFIVAVHVPIAGMGLLPVLLGWPLLLLPLHVLFLEFVIDPACSFVFEADEHDRGIMQRTPRQVSAKLFSLGMLRRNVLMGLAILVLVLAIYGSTLNQGPNEARAAAFATLIIANLTLIFVNRAPQASLRELLMRTNRVFWWIAAGALSALALALYIPPIASRFQFDPPAASTLVASTVLAVTTVVLAARLVRRWTVE